MLECWASTLGGCSAKLSREHLVSESLWLGSTLKVTGFPWCKGEWREISVSSFTSKILCRHHNTSLSEVDVAGRDLFVSLRRAGEVHMQRSLDPTKGWPFQQRQVIGPLIERWFLKTAINLILSLDIGEIMWPAGERGAKPPFLLVQAAYGQKKLQAPMGLYTPAEIGQTVFDRESIHFVPTFAANGTLVAGVFRFRGLTFMIYFGSERLPRSIRLPIPDERGWQTVRTEYRVREYAWEVGGKPSHRVQVLWPPAYR